MKISGLMFAGLLTIAAVAPALGQEVKLTLSHNAAPGNPKDEGSKHFAACAAEKSSGRIEVQVAGSATLGDDAASITGLRSGSIDMSANSQGPISAAVPEFSALGMPYLFTSSEHAWKVLDGPIGLELANKAEANGMILLGIMDNGIRHTSNNKHPINTPADVAGLKIRTPPDPATVAIFKALGADPQPLKFSELYMALQQGVVDGQENPLMNIHSSKLYEVQKFISLTGHKYETTPFLFSKRSWGRLEDADKQVIQACAKDAVTFQRNMVLETEKRLMTEMPTLGVQMNEVDREPFRAATMSVLDEAYKSDIGEFVREVVTKANETRGQS
jgi:tripartite ATP-independent transporter DctP family solute receptor